MVRSFPCIRVLGEARDEDQAPGCYRCPDLSLPILARPEILGVAPDVYPGVFQVPLQSVNPLLVLMNIGDKRMTWTGTLIVTSHDAEPRRLLTRACATAGVRTARTARLASR